MDAKIFLDNFATAAEAPGGVQRLRELVLNLAVRGRLVAQNPTDQPALAALPAVKTIRAEMVRAGMIPQPRKVEQSAEQLQWFDLPKSWCWTRVNELAVYVQRGKSPKYSDTPTSVPVVSQKCIQWTGFDPKPSRYVDNDTLSSYGPERFLQADDLLWNSTGTGTVGRVALFSWPRPNQRVVADSHVTVLRLAECNVRYILAWLSSVHIQSRIDELTSGTTKQQELNTATAANVPVPLPPRAEQDRIVAKVDELMGLCDELDARRQRRRDANSRFRTSALHVLTEAEAPDDLMKAWERLSANWPILTEQGDGISELQGALSHLAVSGALLPQDPADEPAAILIAQAWQAKPLARRRKAELERISEDKHVLPTGWSWAQVDDLFLVTGGLQKTSVRRPVKNHFPYLRVANVQRGWLDLGQVERFELLGDELERLRLEVGDLLVVEGNGSESEIGRCARWNGEISDCIHQNHLIRCRPLVPGIEQYLMLFLNSPAGMQTMKSLAVTTSGLYNLSVGKIRAIQVPVPPLAEQSRILARYRDLASQCGVLASRLTARDQQGQRLSAALTTVS